MIDIIQKVHGTISPSEAVLDHGEVRLVDCMPRLCPEDQTCEFAVVQSARVSYGDGTKTVNEDRGLIRYLLRHMHTTPFEMMEFKFHCKMPIFVARQWIRTRTANVNEMSGRYSILPNEFYIPTPDGVRKQSTRNKQCSDGQIDDETDSASFVSKLEEICANAYSEYEKALEAGVGREQARMLLPQNLYTDWFWKIDAHNLLHFLKLRCDAHAQYEIRVYAEAMLKLVTPLMPYTIEAWNDYDPYRGAVKYSRLENEKLKECIAKLKGIEELDFKIPLNSGNKREDEEWMIKLDRLN